MRIGVIGGGAIGLLTAFYLRELGHEVTVVTRTVRQKEALHKKGITLFVDGEQKNIFVNTCTYTELGYDANDLWVVTLKQYDLMEFFEEWQSVPNLPPVLFLQNGMGHLERGERYLRTTILAGSVTHGAMKTSDTEVVHTGFGEIVVGNWKSYSDETVLKHLKTSSSFPIIISNDITYILKRKLLVNLVINPLTALYGVRNGELLTNIYFQENAKKVFLEGIRALNMDESEWDYVVQVMELTSENESSMLRDIKHGRRTEIDAITGYVLHKGKEKGLSLPYVSFLHRSIIGLERREV